MSGVPDAALPDGALPALEAASGAHLRLPPQAEARHLVQAAIGLNPDASNGGLGQVRPNAPASLGCGSLLSLGPRLKWLTRCLSVRARRNCPALLVNAGSTCEFKSQGYRWSPVLGNIEYSPTTRTEPTSSGNCQRMVVIGKLLLQILLRGLK